MLCWCIVQKVRWGKCWRTSFPKKIKRSRVTRVIRRPRWNHSWVRLFSFSHSTLIQAVTLISLLHSCMFNFLLLFFKNCSGDHCLAGTITFAPSELHTYSGPFVSPSDRKCDAITDLTRDSTMEVYYDVREKLWTVIFHPQLKY